MSAASSLRIIITRLLFLAFLETIACKTNNVLKKDIIFDVNSSIVQEVVNRNDITFKIAENVLQMSILDMFLQVYVLSNSTNEDCRVASNEYLQALKHYESWALKMLDASSKLQSGIANGNMAEYGSYTQCVKITKAGPARNISGKHCTLAVLPPELFVKKMLLSRNITEKTYQDVRNLFLNTPLEWSICVPDACAPADIFNHFEHIVDEVFDGLNATLQSEIHCSTWADVDLPFTQTEKIVFGFLAVLCVLLVISTAVDVYKRNMAVEHGYETIFSLVANSRWLIASRNSHQQLACIDGIRVLSIVTVIIGHRFLMSIFFASVNSFEIVEWVINYSSQLIIGGTVSVDSFLLLSGLLLSYHFLLSQEKSRKFNYFAYLIHHYLRLAPSYGFLILMVTVFGQRFGMGPKWTQNCDGLQEPCKDYWWSALLNIQSFVNPKKVCFLQTWYLSIDMFNYALAPLLLLPLVRNARLGCAAMGVAIVVVLCSNFVQVMSKKWVVTGLLDKNLPITTFFVEHYTQPHIRASPYIIGIALGFLIYKHRDRKVRMPPLVVAVGWTCSIGLLATVILANRVFLDPGYAYNAAEVAAYVAVHRSVWALALAWIVWACATGYGGPVNTLLSSHIFSVLAKLTYSAFLIHMPFQYFDNGAAKVPNYFSNLSLLHKGLGDIGISFFIGYFVTIFVECPVYRLSLLVFKGHSKVKPAKIINVKPR